MGIRPARLEPLALSASGHERMINGRATASGEKRIDLSEDIAWLGDILNSGIPDAHHRLLSRLQLQSLKLGMPLVAVPRLVQGLAGDDLKSMGTKARWGRDGRALVVEG